MEAKQAQEQTNELSNQTAVVEAEVSDVDFNHVRGLMYALVTVCVFCASILLGPDEQILPADGELQFPIVDLTINQGSFLYFGPIIIICVSMYAYLFLLKILADVKAGREDSDQYIFTMQTPAAQVATYFIFFWLPTIVLFAFAYKALPRPESANLLGVSLIFLISIISIQVTLRIYKVHFLGVIAVSIFCVSLVLIGFVGDRGWLQTVRLQLHALRPMALEKVNLMGRDLRNIDIRNAQAELIVLNKADLRGASLKEANLKTANMAQANLQKATLTCTDLSGANLFDADLSEARLFVTNLAEADLREAEMAAANFYTADADGLCSDDGLIRSNLAGARLEKANLSKANLSNTSLGQSTLDGAKLFQTRLIDARAQSSSFRELDGIRADLTKADLRCASLDAAKMDRAVLKKAEFGGANLTYAILTGADLTGANFGPLSCSESCIGVYIQNEECSGEDNMQEGCECQADEKDSAQLVFANLAFADLTKANLEGADLTNADLRGAKLFGTDFSRATLDSSNFMLAQLSGAIGLSCEQLKTAKHWKASIRDDTLECGQGFLSFEGLDEVTPVRDEDAVDEFKAVIEQYARYSREDRRRKKAKGGRLRAPDIMDNAMMSRINLTRFNLEGIWLRNANLKAATLKNTNFKGANLKDANLRGAMMLGANLLGAVLDGANLQKTILRNARLEGAKLKSALLGGADLKGANLKGVKGLTCPQLTSAENWRESVRDEKLDCGS